MERFRDYLGEKYKDKDNYEVSTEALPSGKAKKTRTPIPIYCIYLLGKGYGNLSPSHSIIKMNSKIKNAITGKVIREKFYEN